MNLIQSKEKERDLVFFELKSAAAGRQLTAKARFHLG